MNKFQAHGCMPLNDGIRMHGEERCGVPDLDRWTRQGFMSGLDDVAVVCDCRDGRHYEWPVLKMTNKEPDMNMRSQDKQQAITGGLQSNDEGDAVNAEKRQSKKAIVALNRFEQALAELPAPGEGEGCHLAVLGVATHGVQAGLDGSYIFQRLRNRITGGSGLVPDTEIWDASNRLTKERQQPSDKTQGKPQCVQMALFPELFPESGDRFGVRTKSHRHGGKGGNRDI